eukprot:356690-Chlamydomonas_euryale.AAC.25
MHRKSVLARPCLLTSSLSNASRVNITCGAGRSARSAFSKCGTSVIGGQACKQITPAWREEGRPCASARQFSFPAPLPLSSLLLHPPAWADPRPEAFHTAPARRGRHRTRAWPSPAQCPKRLCGRQPRHAPCRLSQRPCVGPHARGGP